MSKLNFSEALSAVDRAGGKIARLMAEPSFEVRIYRPMPGDPKEPHLSDELYVIASGSGFFHSDRDFQTFDPGDIFFIPAGTTHKFADFSADFVAWVISFGDKAVH
jgi:mannose-6-phosphate isomerase-like protein (cupin superfamily)